MTNVHALQRNLTFEDVHQHTYNKVRHSLMYKQSYTDTDFSPLFHILVYKYYNMILYDASASACDFPGHEHFVFLVVVCRVLNTFQNNSIIYKEMK